MLVKCFEHKYEFASGDDERLAFDDEQCNAVDFRLGRIHLAEMPVAYEHVGDVLADVSMVAFDQRIDGVDRWRDAIVIIDVIVIVRFDRRELCRRFRCVNKKTRMTRS